MSGRGPSRRCGRRLAIGKPHIREAGQGPVVICLHAAASSSAQWRPLMERLAPSFHVIAADSFGAGRSPHWPIDRRLTLDDELALLSPVLARAGPRFTLIGHSYGAALALLTTLRHVDRVSSLVLYEPTLFSLLDAHTPPPNQAQGLRDVGVAAEAALVQGRRDAAARLFIDYWMGDGAFDRMPASRRQSIEATIVNMRGWTSALFDEPTPLASFAALELPVLLMVGCESPPSSQAVSRLLARALPRLTCEWFAGLGHMGPVTHPDVVNNRIVAFLGIDSANGGSQS